MNYAIHHPDHPERVIGKYALSGMPGCARIGISHGLEVFPKYRGQKLSSRTQQERDDLAKSLGFMVVISTTAEKNNPQIHRQEVNGAKKVMRFHNETTGNDVGLYVRHLYDWRQNL